MSEPGSHRAGPDDVNETRTDLTAERADEPSFVLHEERAQLGTETHEAGSVRVRKHVESYPVEKTVPRSVEHADTSERIPASEGDSGEVEVLDDGSVSIPIFEEVLVVTKRLVVRERVIVRKRTVVDEYRLQTDLRREHAEIDTEGDVDLERADRGPDPTGDQRST